VPVVQARLGELVGEQAEAGNVARPTPPRRPKREDRDLERVPRHRVIDPDRAGHRIHAAEVELLEIRGRGGLRELARRSVDGLELDAFARRDSQARQTYLLKNAVGQDLKAWKKSEVADANQGAPLPRPGGDMIGETLRGKSGYLYFNGAQYSWYDPRTFKGEAEVRLTHPGIKPKPNKFDLLHPKLVAAEK